MLTVVVIPLLVLIVTQGRRYHEWLEHRGRADGHLKLDVEKLSEPILVVPLKRLDRVTAKAVRLAVTLSGEVRAVQSLAGFFSAAPSNYMEKGIAVVPLHLACL